VTGDEEEVHIVINEKPINHKQKGLLSMGVSVLARPHELGCQCTAGKKYFHRYLRSFENNGILKLVRFLLSRVNGDAHVRDREATTGVEERVRLVVNLLEAALKFVRASGASRFAAKGQ